MGKANNSWSDRVTIASYEVPYRSMMVCISHYKDGFTKDITLHDGFGRKICSVNTGYKEDRLKPYQFLMRDFRKMPMVRDAIEAGVFKLTDEKLDSEPIWAVTALIPSVNEPRS